MERYSDKVARQQLEKIFILNCAYNQDVDKDGKCLAIGCMIRSSDRFTEEEKEKCKCYKNISKRTAIK